MLKLNSEAFSVGRISKVRLFHISFAEEIEAREHAFPTVRRPNNVLRIPRKAPRISLPPVWRKTGRPSRLKSVRSKNEGDNAEGDLHKASRRTPPFAFEFRDECIKTRSKEKCESEKHHHTPEDDFRPHLSVESHDFKTKALSHITSGMEDGGRMTKDRRQPSQAWSPDTLA